MSDHDKPSANERTLRQCAQCGMDRFVDTRSLLYERAQWRMAVLRFTPKEVWKQYQDDGVSLIKAIETEMSYAG